LGEGVGCHDGWHRPARADKQACAHANDVCEVRRLDSYCEWTIGAEQRFVDEGWH